MAQARQDKKNAEGKSMTQKELATAMNVKPTDVSDYSSPLWIRLLSRGRMDWKEMREHR